MEQVEAPKFSRASLEKAAILAETTPDGRYIPYSGGIMGWFENSGVLRKEVPNNYRFHTIIDASSVRRKLFERWGSGEKVNRRISARHDLETQVELTLAWGEYTAPATTKDFSTHGLRLQVRQEGDLHLSKGDGLQVQIFETPEGGKKLFDIPSQVMWVTRAGRKRPVWGLGVAFLDIPFETREQLRLHFNV